MTAEKEGAMTTGALDIEEQNATCSRCGQAIKRYGSDGIWFTDRYDCGGDLHAPAALIVVARP